MRTPLALVLCFGLVCPALAEVDQNLMDLNQGLWTLSSGDGQSCDITLGDRPANEGARVIDDAGDCRTLVPEMANATAWRIDTPGTLIFLSDSDKALLSLHFDRSEGEFKNPDRSPPLVMSPLD